MDDINRRTTKEYKIVDNLFPTIKIKYGTLDKNNPEIIYIRSKARITPTIKKKDYNDSVSIIKKEFIKNVKTIVKSYSKFEGKHICSLEMSDNGIAFGKKSYIKYDVYVKPKEIKKIDEYENDIKNMISDVDIMLNHLLEINDIGLSLKNTKKESV